MWSYGSSGSVVVVLLWALFDILSNMNMNTLTNKGFEQDQTVPKKQSYVLKYQQNYTLKVPEYNSTLCAESTLRSSHRVGKKKKIKGIENWKAISVFLKIGISYKPVTDFSRVLNQIVSDLTD